jgi:hypothetical protein
VDVGGAGSLGWGLKGGWHPNARPWLSLFQEGRGE